MASQKSIASFFPPTKKKKVDSSEDNRVVSSSSNIKESLDVSNTKETGRSKVVSKEHFVPPSNFKFPEKKFGNETFRRSCQPKWFVEFPWLHYDLASDSVLCFKCMKSEENSYLLAERKKEQAFISLGFSNWKKARKRFAKHQGTLCHKASVTYEETVQKSGNCPEMINSSVKKEHEINQKCLIVIIESLQYLARQGIPLRGHDDVESNFNQLLVVRSKDVPEFQTWLIKKKGKYTSHDVQNELINIMANQVLSKLLPLIRQTIFSLICDEGTDFSNKELLSFCLRWVDNNLDVHEHFLGFYEIPDIKSPTIVASIKDIMIRMQLEFDKCRGQCYDGASNMLGRKAGVAQLIKKIQPKAHETHCHGHSISLSVKDATKQSKILEKTMGIAREIIVLIKYSPKRENLLGSIKEQVEFHDEPEERANNLKKLSETRWTIRATCMQRILDNYESVMKVWIECLDNDEMKYDLKGKIIGVRSQMETFDLFFGLNLASRIYTHTDNLAKSVQGKKMSATSSKRVVDLTIKVLQSIRDDLHFNSFFDVVQKKAESISFIRDPKLGRKTKDPAHYSILNYLHGFEQTDQGFFPSSPRESYRIKYFEALDCLINALQERFNQPSFVAFEKLESFLTKSLSGEAHEEEKEYIKMEYSEDIHIELLVHEVDVLKIVIGDETVSCLDDILKCLTDCKDQLTLMPNITTLIKLLIVNPATSSSSERSFSLARRLKTWLRSTMLTKRFNALAILHEHKELTDKIDLKVVASEFASLNES